jgi:hypothetical protein
MTLTIDQIKGSFVDAIAIATVEQCDAIIPNDMRREAVDALQGNGTDTESVIYYASWHYATNSESTQVILFPNAGRGGACEGGYTAWCNASTLDQVEAAYQNDEMD